MWRPARAVCAESGECAAEEGAVVHVDLFGATLMNCDLRMADLRQRGCGMQRRQDQLAQADLQDALMQGIDAEGGDFSQANLTRVNAREEISRMRISRRRFFDMRRLRRPIWWGRICGRRDSRERFCDGRG